MFNFYTYPELRDLSQGSRIVFARQFKHMTQDNVSDKLGLTGECKRRTMTRYEKGDRNPKFDRTLEIARKLNISVNAIKKYDYKDPIDIIYILKDNYEFLDDIRKIRNKYEHKMHDVKHYSSESGSTSLFDFTFFMMNCMLYFLYKKGKL